MSSDSHRAAAIRGIAFSGLVACCSTAPQAAEFSVSPIQVELKAGALSETITVTNHAKVPLRVGVKLMQWTQDATGNDVYLETSDLVYFPRQMELQPGSRRLVRVGGKTAAGLMERAYRLFIEEQPEATSGAKAQVAVTFRFGVPIFLPPAVARPGPEVMEPTLDQGKVSLVVKNGGNQRLRLFKLTFSDGAGYTQEIPGWYSLPGTQRTYTAEIPAEICRQAKSLSINMEGEGIRFDRTLNVNPSRCL